MTDQRPPGAHRAAPRRRTALILGLAGLTVLAVLGALLVGRPGAEVDGQASPSAPASMSASAETVPGEHGDLGRWIETELSDDVQIVAPAAVRADLLAAGVPTGRLVPVDGAPAGALLVLVDEAAPPSSIVLARFGSSGDALTIVDPKPGVPTADELSRRERLSAAVLANPGTRAVGRAADVLRAADIDARLLGLLSVLVAQLGVGVADFPLPPAQPADGPPARQVLLDRIGEAPLGRDDAATDRLTTFLAAQLSPFAPDRFQVTEAGVLITFRYASAPDADVTENTP